MKAWTAVGMLIVSLAAVPALAGEPQIPRRDLSLQLEERPLKLDVSGSYEPSPVPIIFRDAIFGAMAGAAVGGVVGAAADQNNWGRDLAIGAGAGFLLGAMVGVLDANTSGPRISVHADRVGPVSEGSSALGGPAVNLGRRF